MLCRNHPSRERTTGTFATTPDSISPARRPPLEVTTVANTVSRDRVRVSTLTERNGGTLSGATRAPPVLTCKELSSERRNAPSTSDSSLTQTALLESAPLFDRRYSATCNAICPPISAESRVVSACPRVRAGERSEEHTRAWNNRILGCIDAWAAG